MPALRDLWQILADSTRLRILALVGLEELSVAELQHILHLGQSRISTHLSVLRSARLVQARRDGKRVYYSLSRTLSAREKQLLDAGFETLAEIPAAAKDPQALKLILEKRRQAARDYFNRVAGRAGKNFCPGRTWAQVGPLLAAMIPPVVVADLGAGEGELSRLIAQHAKQVIAVDNSPKMVAFGKTQAAQKQITNLEYRLGDLADPPIPRESVDIVMLSQALHHAAQPAGAVLAASRILKRGGKLVILDLNQHLFDKARELYGDLWLGFSEVDLRQWMTDAGFGAISIQLLPAEEKPPRLQPLLAVATKN
jgi:ArsR family transcriptional regulator